MTDIGFEAWFEEASGFAPRAWQVTLSNASRCVDRLVRVPTGFGKTLGVVGAWAYHSLVRRTPKWPRRLVIVLPMRVLVEQTVREVEVFLARAGMREPNETPAQNGASQGVAVHTLMGGVAAERWHLLPEQPAVLVGTQDMLLSRALNRGYASARPRWPMEFGLLHHDALWVLDEVQLMGVGLTTAMQLQSFRAGSGQLRPSATWCMSATLQPAWIGHGEARANLGALCDTMLQIPAAQRAGGLFAISKSLEVTSIPRAEDLKATRWAKTVWDAHGALGASEHGRITLAVCNTVDEACTLHASVAKLAEGGDVELRLVHSRFRGVERRQWAQDFLSRSACTAQANRIIVATQVVEAGVDISAGALVTQLAPWASLVQRVGRCARYGGTGCVTVVDRALGETSCAPYAHPELEAARGALKRLDDVGTASLESFEDALHAEEPELLAALYPFEPLHVLCRRDFEDLFDTEADLTGEDLDISRFIREGEERDLSVFWWSVGEQDPDAQLQPTRDALCPVPVGGARKWLMDGARLKDGVRAWSWDYVDGAWRRLGGRALRPGVIVLVDEAAGGYDSLLGFTGTKAKRGQPRLSFDGAVAALSAHERAELAPAHEDQSASAYKTIATHGREAAEEVAALCKALGLSEDVSSWVELAGAIHDVGKSHPAFVHACDPAKRDEPFKDRCDLAKAPPHVWRRGPRMFADAQGTPRPGFRHELVSALMLFEWLRATDPYHPALLGPHRSLVDAGLLGGPEAPPSGPPPSPAVGERLRALDAAAFDLVAYLVCAHHGKVRGSWASTPHDQDVGVRHGATPAIRGVLEGDETPELTIATSAERLAEAPPSVLSLDAARVGLSSRYGASWRERVTALREQWGPAALAYLETLVRVADVRASQRTTPDSRLAEQETP